MRTNGRVVVPMSALRPLLAAWSSRNTTECSTEWKTENKGIGRLAKESGVPERRISGILNDSMPQQVNVSFDTADKLLTAMQMNSEWHVSLAEYYVELEVAPYERDRVVPVLVTA